MLNGKRLRRVGTSRGTEDNSSQLATRLILLAGLAMTLVLMGCGPAKAPPSNILKPIEERRARAMIEQILQRQQQNPGPGRIIILSNKQQLNEDVSLMSSRYGVAYLTAEEAADAGDAIPKYNPDSQQLRLVRGTEKEVVLVLYEQAYQYDAGDAHSTTAVTAERRLKRDVEDFVTHVVRQEKMK